MVRAACQPPVWPRRWTGADGADGIDFPTLVQRAGIAFASLTRFAEGVGRCYAVTASNRHGCALLSQWGSCVLHSHTTTVRSTLYTHHVGLRLRRPHVTTTHHEQATQCPKETFTLLVTSIRHASVHA